MTVKTVDQQGFGQILAALATMQSNAQRKEKTQAHELLEQFQKSQQAWNVTNAMLHDSSTTPEAKLFAATTLKGKIIYDLHQVPATALVPLRDNILALVQVYSRGPRPIRIQLCVCLASLAIQMTTWKNVMETVGSAIGSTSDGGDTLLDFLTVLPEEVIEGRRINLSEEELADRTRELLEDNAQQVLKLLVSYAQSSAAAATNARLYECISSWLREIPAADVVASPLLDNILQAINNDESFDAAVECLCTIYKDTRDIDDSKDVIKALYPRVMALRPKIQEAADAEDPDFMKGITRIFAEAGEAWVVLIARLPTEFRALVEAVLECCARDVDREAISLTFLFWDDLKQYLTLEKYASSRQALSDIWSKLIDVMIKHLQFPTPESGNEKDLFDGDRAQEDKFREFRHSMGDVLKYCCEVIGVSESLTKAFNLIQQWGQTYASQSTPTVVPHWQELEAPLFALRAMGRMVSPEESTILPQVIPLLVTIPDHEKLKFQAIMALGRYTEWTAQHPDTLGAQLTYVITGFNHTSPEVVQASALAFQYLGLDCRRLLGDHIGQLHTFYEGVIDKLKPSSQEEVTEGVAAVVSVQQINKIYASLKLFCDPIMTRVMALANHASDDAGQKKVADYLQLITIFIQHVTPYVSPQEENPCVKYCKEILPTLAVLASNFSHSIPIIERVCRCWRYMFISYRTAMAPLLNELAPNIANGFEASRQGCFLWASDAVIREFADGAEFVDQQTTDNVFEFFAQQALVFLRILTQISPADLPDVIEDFYRLATDAVRFYPEKTTKSHLAEPMMQAALTALTLEQVDPLIATLHFIRDFLGFGYPDPPTSELSGPPDEIKPYNNPPEVISAVHRILTTTGPDLVQRVLTGMMFNFPQECFPDASAVLLSLFNIMPQAVAQWVQNTISLLPAGTLKPEEGKKLMNGIQAKIREGEPRKVRILLQDFTTAYRRRNVAPREGLGRLEAARFRFQG